jgi:opacity protein-like surface antigen
MRFRLFVHSVLAVSIFAVAVPAISQVVPAYQRRALPIVLGIGPSSYDVDWGHGRMLGGTIWGDWYPQKLPHILRGLGVEGELRDISLNRSSTQANMRQDTAGIGAIYAWRHFQNFHPYAKYLISYGSMDFDIQNPTYSHDTRTLYAPGGGLEIRIYREFWARADYEYQTWQMMLGYTPHPQGFTVGVAYDFAHHFPKNR